MGQTENTIREVLLLHHTHTDIGYTHAQPILWELQRRFIDQAIDCCEQTADWPEPSRMRWTCEVTSTLQHWLRHASCRQIDRFRALVQAGQMSSGAMFTNGTQLSNADQLARGLHPLKELREVLGLPLTVAINHDVNGLSWPYTQLLNGAGVEMLLMGINAHFGGYPLERPRAFRWRGADGGELLTWNGEHYSIFGCVLVGRPGLNDVNSTDLMAEALDRHFQHLSKTGYPYDFAFMTGTHVYHCDNNPPYMAQAQMVRRWNAEGRFPPIRFVTPEQFLDRIKQIPSDQVPAHSGEWTDYWSFGAGSSALETKINRDTVRRLGGAEMLRAYLGQKNPEAERWIDQAWWNSNLYDEHTWGSAFPLGPAIEASAEQWCHKAYYAYQARSLTSMVLRDELASLTGNPEEADESHGLLLANFASVARRVLVHVPKNLVEGSWKNFSSNVQRLDLYCQQLTEQTGQWIGPIDLPASGYRVLALSDLTPAQTPDVLVQGEDFIESPFHRLTFNQQTGRITGLLDKQQQWQVIDSSSEWPFFGFVRETLDTGRLPESDLGNGGRDAFFKARPDPLVPTPPAWNPDWPAVRSGPTRLLDLRTERTGGRVSLILEWEAAGVEQLRQRISLFAHRDAIELDASFSKNEVVSPEGIYFAFPVNLPTWKAFFDTADVPLQFDEEQLPGVCRDYVSVGRWITLADQRQGVTLATPDAPLVQIGGFNFGQAREAYKSSAYPLLLSWVMNNYWHTNFRISQPGPARFRYELKTHGPYDPVPTVRAGLEAAYPVEIHPVVGNSNGRSGQFIELVGHGVFLLQMKPANDQKGVIVAIINVTQQRVQAAVRLPARAMTRAWRSDSLERSAALLNVTNNAAQVTLNGREIAILRLDVDKA